ncbi:uncharacterized protein CXorf65 homolog [Babylonia areolata]|uniref:uncharacterized protein CXorf65 homolog n=1 Tax=Babylonia areolata TaxID=304850 RepID=UPI003FCFA133
MSYVTVRYGEGQEAIFNPNCRAVSLLRSIRDRCTAHISVTADIDLSDEDGNIKYLRDTPFRYASEILGDRECLILLRVDKHDGAYASYTPLLKDDEAITEEFLARLCVREETSDDHSENSRRAKSDTRRSPSDKVEKDGRKNKGDQRSRALKLEKQLARSRSRQGK